jgi:hypothetical protein
MSNPFNTHLTRRNLSRTLALFGLTAVHSVIAQTYVLHEASSVTQVAVNGGADTANPGVTCIQVTPPPPSAQCVAGFIAIPNNNKTMINAALMAKATSSSVRAYYNHVTTDMHCPGHVFTRCSLNNLDLK